MSDTWNCPFCTHRVPYGQPCPDDWQTCERGEKNVIWLMKMIAVHRQENQRDEPVRGVGISEISDEGNE